MGWLKGRYMIDACSITKYLWPTPSTIDQYRILVLPLYQEQPQNLNFEDTSHDKWPLRLGKRRLQEAGCSAESKNR
uniref:Ras-related small GTP-binding family protein n=1 Tax=Haemonchus contortus TaxID=6289 RepID=A0A7I5EEL0_HAECO